MGRRRELSLPGWVSADRKSLVFDILFTLTYAAATTPASHLIPPHPWEGDSVVQLQLTEEEQRLSDNTTSPRPDS